ncbi:hypothetical protein AAGW05_02650 [Arthrobacter sp. LAPM80]|uniref:PGAP1-like alpha/beta domain-containing protein n=1 Tax=Arthrobacter sp. LAPM80 TaxID=3141788 RepID=UPI00398AF665
MQGLDPQDCRDFVKLLKNSAHQLDGATAQLNQTVSRTGWQGPDSQRFRAQWPGNRSRLQQTARELQDLAAVVLRNIEEQERASAVDGGGPLAELIDGAKDLWDDVTEGVGNVVDGVKDGVAGAVDVVKDGLGWLREEIKASPIFQANANVFGNLAHLFSLPFQPLWGDPPSLLSVVTSVILVGGGLVDASVTNVTGGLVNLNLFRESEPKVGTPTAVGHSSDVPLQQPTSVAKIFDGVLGAYSATDADGNQSASVRIVKVEQPDGSFAYIVNVPGTETNSANGNKNPLDYTSNLRLVSGQSSAASKAVAEAMANAGIPSNAPVMLVGHSQGGMIAQELATDKSFTQKFNVTNVLTAGSPTQPYAIDPGINYLAIAHTHDIVPLFDGQGLLASGKVYHQPPNVNIVYTDNPAFNGSPGEFVPAMHDQNTYRADLTQTAKYSGIADFENSKSTQRFMTEDPSKVSAVDVAFSR